MLVDVSGKGERATGEVFLRRKILKGNFLVFF